MDPIVVIAVLALIIVISNIHIVQQSRAYVIERLGAFSKVWQVGMHIKVPFIERVAKGQPEGAGVTIRRSP